MPTHSKIRLAIGAAALTVLPVLATPAAAAQSDPLWSVDTCGASTTLTGDITLKVEVEDCAPGRFQLTGGQKMSWPGFNNAWYDPDVSSGLVAPSLDSTGKGSGRLVFSFSKPVTDPVLHIADFGGGVGGTPATWFTQRWTLATPGLSLERTAGNSRFEVSGNTAKGRDVGSIQKATCTSDFGCGSVRIKGTVTSVAFDVDVEAVMRCCPVKLERTTFTVTVPEAPAKQPPAAPDGLYAGPVGTALTGTLASAGADGGPITYTVLDPAKLPPGVIIGANGVIAGTPSKPGLYQVQVRACDSGGACSEGRAAFSVHECPSVPVKPKPPIVVPSPQETDDYSPPSPDGS